MTTAALPGLPDAGVRRDDLRRDVGPRGSRPPRSTSARASPTPTARRGADAAVAPSAPATTSIRREPGIPELRRAIADHQQRWLRARARSRPRSAGDCRRHRSHRRVAARAVRAGRRGRHVRAVLRLLRRVHRAGRARSAASCSCERPIPFDPDDLAPRSHRAPALMLLNSPHNPTGKVFSARRARGDRPLCVEHDLVAVTDEVYEHLVFEGEHIPLATLPGMRERTLTISSGGKTFSFTGWKVGWVCGPARAGRPRSARSSSSSPT